MPKKNGIKIPQIRQLPSGSWFCQLRLTAPDGSQKSISITDAEYNVVEAKAMAVKVGILEEKKSPANAITLTRAIDKYIAERKNTLSPSTIRGYRTIQRSRFQAYMNKPLGSIDESTCRRMVNAEAKLCAPKTVKNSWLFVSSVIFETSGRRFSIPLPQDPGNERPFLDPEQIPVFVAAVKDKPVEIPALLALCSLRRSEIMGLTWDKVDLKNKTITVSGAAVYDENQKLVYKKTNKNKSSKRIVPIMIPALFDALDKVPDKSGSVVKYAPNTLTRQINRICEENSLPAVSMHGLRHSFASLAYHLQIPEKIAMKIGGWTNDATMRRIYTHIADKDIASYENKMLEYYIQNIK